MLFSDSLFSMRIRKEKQRQKKATQEISVEARLNKSRESLIMELRSTELLGDREQENRRNDQIAKLIKNMYVFLKKDLQKK